MKFIKSGEKKRILRDLEDQFGIKKLDYVLLETGKQKIRGFSGTMTKEEIRELGEIANVEIVGLYLIKKEGQMRLGLDATSLLKDNVKKSVIEIMDGDVEEWFKGNNLEIVKDNGIYIIKHGEDFLGCGVSDGKKIINYVPKERRIRKG